MIGWIVEKIRTSRTSQSRLCYVMIGAYLGFLFWKGLYKTWRNHMIFAPWKPRFLVWVSALGADLQTLFIRKVTFTGLEKTLEFIGSAWICCVARLMACRDIAIAWALTSEVKKLSTRRVLPLFQVESNQVLREACAVWCFHDNKMPICVSSWWFLAEFILGRII